MPNNPANPIPRWLPKTWKDKDTGKVYRFRQAWEYQTEANGEAGPVGFVARFEDGTDKVVIPFFKPSDRRPGAFLAGAAPDPRPLFGLETLKGKEAVFIVEGEKDAAALHLLGYAAVSVCGGGKTVAKSDWGPILNPPGGIPPRLMIWPDDDEPGRAYAAAIWERIEAADAADRARVLVEPPAGTPKEKGAGAADWVAAILAAYGEQWDGLGPLPEAINRDKVKEIRARLAESIKGRAGPLPEAWVPAPEPGKTPSRTARRNRPNYITTPRGTFRLRYTKEGPVDEQLSNFAARILEEVERDDGRERQRLITLSGELEGRALESATVSVDDFHGMKWPMKHWGTACMIFPARSAIDHLRIAIQETSHRDGEVKRRTLYTHTGWREIGGEWAYLSGGGAIGPTGLLEGTETDLSELEAYSLPEPSASQADRFAAAVASRSAANSAPPYVAVPMVASMFLAPLSEALRPDLFLWLEGPSRTRKSSYAALLLAHFGPEIERTRLPANWHDTYASMEYKAFILKDAPLVVDDYAPIATPSAKAAMDAAAQKLIRHIGNRSSRGRQQADMTQRKGFPPRGLVLATGEQYPEGESVTARLFGVSLRPGDVDLEQLTSAQTDAAAGLLARCMADHLQGVASAYPERVQAAKEAWKAYRSKAMAAGLDGRLQEQVAFLMVGYDFALEHWTRAGAIAEDQRRSEQAEAWEVLCELARAHHVRIQTEQPAETFLHTLRELFAVGAVHVRAKETDERPLNAELLGWGGDYAKGQFVGWYSDIDKAFYLIPGTTLNAVSEALLKTSHKINLRPSDLWRQCEDRGFIREGGASSPSDGERRRGRKVRIANQGARRVLVFEAAAIVEPE